MKLFINNSNNSNQSKISVKEEKINTLNNELIPISPSNGRSEYIFNSDSLILKKLTMEDYLNMTLKIKKSYGNILIGMTLQITTI